MFVKLDTKTGIYDLVSIKRGLTGWAKYKIVDMTRNKKKAKDWCLICGQFHPVIYD